MSRKERRSVQKKKSRASGSGKRLSAEAAEQKFANAYALFEQRKFEDAASLADRLMGTLPPAVDLFQLRGLIELEQQKFREAAAIFQKGLGLFPNAAPLCDLLGTAFSEMGQLDEAVAAYRRALINNPRNPGALNNLGLALQKRGEFEKAEKAFRDSLIYRPGDLTTHLNLADVLEQQEKFPEVLALYKTLIENNTCGSDAYMAYAEYLMKWHKWEDALEIAEKAVSKGILDADLYTLKAYALGAMSRFEEAERATRQALELDPDRTQAQIALSILYFYQEKWAQAWQAYEARWKLPTLNPRPYPQPVWQGEPLAGKNVLLCGEQGIGDEVLYGTMIPDLLALGPEVTFETDARLVPLFKRAFSGMTCVPRSDPPPEGLQTAAYDYQISLGGLGQHLRKTTADFGSGVAYLKADPQKVEYLRQKYQKGEDLLIGLAWYSSDSRGLSKSVPLQRLAPFFDVPGVRFVDLQYGDTLKERQAFAETTGFSLIHDADIDQMASLDDFAAQIAAMDLVVSISNSTVHLAGALGVPTWVMLQSAPMQRWLMERSDSPWYASVELFRQRKANDWDDLINRVADRLTKFKK